MIPRIRARVGNGEDGKFYFEISLWNLAGTVRIGEPFTFGPYETDKLAHEEMKKAVQNVTEQVEKFGGFKPSGQYLDMKNGGVLRPWVQQ